ncbi:hypothetical protein BX666DRAFT_1988336 [Dichotomocladium elegans]|nr:hypothetical protein BX666DRAFT_1988336 [Dichotomocladium elegans]
MSPQNQELLDKGHIPLVFLLVNLLLSIPTESKVVGVSECISAFATQKLEQHITGINIKHMLWVAKDISWEFLRKRLNEIPPTYTLFRIKGISCVVI